MRPHRGLFWRRAAGGDGGEGLCGETESDRVIRGGIVCQDERRRRLGTPALRVEPSIRHNDMAAEEQPMDESPLSNNSMVGKICHQEPVLDLFNFNSKQLLNLRGDESGRSFFFCFFVFL